MPKVFDKTGGKLQYPPGCREISDELSKDELLKRLKVSSTRPHTGAVSDPEIARDRIAHPFEICGCLKKMLTHARKSVHVGADCDFIQTP